MEINRANSAQSFGSIYGDASRIMKDLGKGAMDVVIKQKKNDVADVFVGKYGDIKIKARPGYKIPLERYNPDSKMVDELNVTWRRRGEGFMAATDHLECRTQSGEKVIVDVPSGYDRFGDHYFESNELTGALSIADEAYRHANKAHMPNVLNDKESMTKILGAVIDAEI